jgi:hypothetical protein
MESTGSNLILLQGVLFSLTFATTDTLGSRALVSKGRPRTEVLAALAPFDFESIVHNDPNSNITCGTEALVLSGDNVSAVWIFLHVPDGGGIVLFTTAAHQTGSRANSQLATHDTVLLAICSRGRIRPRGGSRLGEIVGEIYQAMEIRESGIFGLFGFTVNVMSCHVGARRNRKICEMRDRMENQNSQRMILFSWTVLTPSILMEWAP